jgi:hypothetical protein
LVGKALGFTVAGAGAEEHAATGGLRELVGEILPHGEGAEAFVKHDDGGLGLRRRIEKRLKALGINGEVTELF